MEGFAEDVVARAQYGRRHELRIYQDPLSKSGLHARGATLRHDGRIGRYGRAGQGSARSAVHGQSILRLMIAPEVLGSDPIDYRDDRHLLLGLSMDDGIEVLVDAQDAEYRPEWTSIGRVSVGRTIGLGMRELIAEGPRSTRVAAFHHESMLFFAGLLGSHDSADSATRTAAMLLASKEIKADLFVTNRHVLIGTRNRPSRVGASAGIATPREAIRIACAIQRGRGTYIISEPGSRLMCDETTFYTSLANCHLPCTLTALRSSLSPRLPSERRILANYLEALLVKYQHMLIAADDVGRVTLAEGLHDATRSDSMRLVAHIQNSVVLFTSALDVVAGIVAQLGAVGRADRNQVNWQRLIKGRQPFNELTATGVQLRNAACACNDELTRFTVNARNYYQHRGSLGMSLARYGTNGELGTYSLLDLESVAHEYSVEVPALWVGPLRDGHIQPVSYQHSLTQRLRALLESVLTATSWPDTDWWEDNRHDELDNDLIINARARQWWW